MNRFAYLAVLVVLPLSMTSCSKSTNKAPTLAKVSGTVNMDGKAMGGGEIRFSVPGQPVKVIAIKDGTFAGEAHVGKNLVEVVWDVDGPPNPMDPSTPIKVNSVSTKFLGANSPLSADVNAGGSTDLKFDVTSASKR